MLLWGMKTEAAFDVWSVEHLMMGMTFRPYRPKNDRFGTRVRRFVQKNHPDFGFNVFLYVGNG